MKNLRYLRKQKKLTQVQLSEELNIAQATLWGYETGNHEPDIVTLLKIANYFHVSVDYLLGRTDDLGNIVIQGENHFPTSLLEQQLVLDFRKLPTETQDNFAALFHNLAMGA